MNTYEVVARLRSLRCTAQASVVNQRVRFQLPVCPGLSVIEAPRSVLGGGVLLMSTPPCRYVRHTRSLYGGM